MAKRRQRESAGVSLFPFLSILACVIGTLTLMITALALGQIGREQSPEVIARAAEYKKKLADIEASREEIERLKKLMAKAEEIQYDLEEALEQLKLLEEQKEKKATVVDSKKKLNIQLLANANRYQKRIEELTPDLAKLQADIKALQAEMKERKTPPKEAVVRIQSGGSGTDLDPTFVECTATGIVIFDGSKPLRIRRADLSKSLPFITTLDRVAAKPKGTVVFLIRTNGVATYNTARNVARSRYCRNGKLPVSGQGQLDLSVFGQKFKG